MRDRDAYERNKVKQEARREKTLRQRWRERLSNADRIIQILLVAFTFGIGIVGFLQWRTLDKTDRTLKAEQRPWVSVGYPRPVSDFQFVESGAILTVEFDLRNTGNSPALNVEIDGQMPVLKGHMNPLGIQAKICEELQKRPIGDRGNGLTIFPNYPAIPQKMQFGIDKKEIEEESKKMQSALGPPVIVPFIVGCLRYVLAADSSQHDTGFIFNVSHMPPDGLIRTDQGNVPQNQLLLIQPTFGSGRTN